MKYLIDVFSHITVVVCIFKRESVSEINEQNKFD